MASAGEINYLEVDNDVVIFSTDEAKTASSPTCVQADNADQWTVSLASESGRAIYSLILTAMAKESMNLSVSSAQDCADSSGIERAANVFLAKAEEVPTPSESDVNTVGTIMEGFMEVNNANLVDASKEFVSSNSYDYFRYMNRYSGPGEVKFGQHRTHSKSKLASIDGSGWITSIILPAADYEDAHVSLEIIVDGQKHEFSTVHQNIGARQVMGVVEGHGNLKQTGYESGIRLAIPSKVVTLGKGIAYKESAEIWLQMEYPNTSNYRFWAVQYLKGTSFKK